MYTRYLIPPRSFWKTWLSHVDAYPLFAANAAGVVLVAYFGYRKMYKHPDCCLHNGNILSPETDGSITEDGIKHIYGWMRWSRQFTHKMMISNEWLLGTSFWLSSHDMAYQMNFDRTNPEFTPPNNPIEFVPTIGASYLQQMVAMEDVSQEEVDNELAEIKKALTANAEKDPLEKYRSLTKEGRIQLIKKFADNAGVLAQQYEVVANSSGSNSSHVKSYCDKIKSFSRALEVTDKDLDDILKPLSNIPPEEEEGLKRMLSY